MRRPLLLTAAMTLFSAAALAQAVIPERYSGSFPSDGVRSQITGTFTGKRLSLRFRRGAGKRVARQTGGDFCPWVWLGH